MFEPLDGLDGRFDSHPTCQSHCSVEGGMVAGIGGDDGGGRNMSELKIGRLGRRGRRKEPSRGRWCRELLLLLLLLLLLMTLLLVSWVGLLLLLVLSSSTISSLPSLTTTLALEALEVSLSPLLLLLEGDIVRTALYSADLVGVLNLFSTVFTFPGKVHGSPNGGQLELGHLLALADVLSQEVHIRGELGKKDHDLEVFFDFHLLLC